MGNPAIFNGRFTKLLTNRGIINQSGGVNEYDGAYNYLPNGHFLTSDVSDWSLFNTTLTSGLPTGSVSAGAGSLTAPAATSTNPLNGIASLQLVAGGAITAGQGMISGAKTMLRRDSAKVLNFSFYYEVVSGGTNADWSGTSTQSMAVYIYDVTASAWVQPTGFRGMNQSSGQGFVTGTFQTSSTSGNQYQLAVICLNATSGAMTMNFSDFYVGPQKIPVGAVMTDMSASVASTITSSGGGVVKGTVTTDKIRWRRIGDHAHITFEYVQTLAGTSGTGVYLVALPTGLVGDTSKTLSDNSGNVFVGSSLGNGWLKAAAGDVAVMDVYLYDSGKVAMSGVNAAQSNIWGSTFCQFGGGALNAAFDIMVPIVGWSSNVQMSNDTDTRVVAALISGDPASATSGNPIIVPTIGYDSHGSYNASTGRYTVPVSGIYKMFGALQSASAATTLTIYKNAGSTSLAGNLDSNGEATFCGAVQCVAGDVIDLRPGGTVDATSMTLNIERVSGPSVVAATESVNARYFASATSVSGSLANITYTTKDFDSHNAYSSGTYTIPVSGKYQVNAGILLTATTTAANNLVQLQINKNGSAYSGPNDNYFTSSTSKPLSLEISDIVSCVAGDTITIQASNGGSTPSISASNSANYFSICRVGN